MTNEELTIQVDPETARAYKAASGEERRKIALLLSMRLRDVMDDDSSLAEIMNDLSEKARQRGLTPDALDAILHE